MNRAIAPLLVLVAAACGGADSPVPARPLGVSDHERAAREHEREAASHDAARRTHARERPEDHYRCIDQALEPPYSGGKPIEILRPCWTEDPVYDHAAAAARHRAEAARHRAMAAALVDVERARCAGLGEAELSQSPFLHRSDVLAVTPIERHGEVVGATIRFRRVPGIDAAWLRHATACHHARAAAMGFVEGFQPFDPLAVAEVEIDVRDADGGVDVAITSARGTSAATVLGRALALLDARAR
jgi:hypothetical protein